METLGIFCEYYLSMFLLDVMQEEDEEAEHVNGEDDGDVDAGILSRVLYILDRVINGTRRRAVSR